MQALLYFKNTNVTGKGVDTGVDSGQCSQVGLFSPFFPFLKNNLLWSW